MKRKVTIEIDCEDDECGACQFRVSVGNFLCDRPYRYVCKAFWNEGLSSAGPYKYRRLIECVRAEELAKGKP